MMFKVKHEFIKRFAFATRLFPKLKSSVGLDLTRLKSSELDGPIFCGGRSKNRDLLTFFGGINQPTGLPSFVYLPIFNRSLKKLTNLVDIELQNVGAQEISIPLLFPQKLWSKSKRLERINLANVYKFETKEGEKILLGPTFEESVTKMMSKFDSVQESELPLLLYQTSTKFRDEPYPKFGLIRSNEFIMNDLYSFDADLERANQTYQIMTQTYDKIFEILGLNCIKTRSGTGSIGGKYSHEYQLPLSSGQDIIVECLNCGQICNSEYIKMTKGGSKELTCISCDSHNIKEDQSLELAHTFLLSDIYSSPFEAKFNSTMKGRKNYEMGCYGLGLTRIIAAGLDLLSIVPRSNSENQLAQLRWPGRVEPYTIGIVSPAKRSEQYNAGSSVFIEKFVSKVLEATRNVDIIVQDRDKDGIAKRVEILQSLGIPNIISVGHRFLQDPPEFELLQLEPNKQGYQQHWFSEDQLFDFVCKLD